jgi:lipopolysaccharide transport system ATP-binding protein
LLLDEVLAVGDIGFTIKCLNKMREIAPNSAICFVTHSMQFVSSFCTRVLVMQGGRSISDTKDTSEGVDRYFSLFPQGSVVSGSKEAQFKDCTLIADGNKMPAGKDAVIQSGSACSIQLSLQTNCSAELAVQIDLDGLNPIFRSDVKSYAEAA